MALEPPSCFPRGWAMGWLFAYFYFSIIRKILKEIWKRSYLCNGKIIPVVFWVTVYGCEESGRKDIDIV